MPGPTMSKSSSSGLQRLVRRFSILKDWNISRADDSDTRGRTCGVEINEVQHIGNIKPWVNALPEPWDYELHEVLHCVLRAFSKLDRRKPKEMRQAEEQLVQELCKIVEDARKGKITDEAFLIGDDYGLHPCRGRDSV